MLFRKRPLIGVSYFTSVPSTVSEPEDSNPSGGVCSCSPARNTTVTPDILVFPSRNRLPDKCRDNLCT
ncbi:hypothetical protein F2M96_00420 [Escherichia coli]|nr:hypothetical protein [Escherichia coli]